MTCAYNFTAKAENRVEDQKDDVGESDFKHINELSNNSQPRNPWLTVVSLLKNLKTSDGGSLAA